MTAKTFEKPTRPRPKVHKRSEGRALTRGLQGLFESSGGQIPSPDDIQKMWEDPAPATLTMCGKSPVSMAASPRLTDDWERVTCRLCLRRKRTTAGPVSPDTVSDD